MKRREIAAQVRRDRRVRRGRAVHRHAGQALLERHADAARVRRRRAPRAGDPDRRRGARGRRRRVPAEVPRQDGRGRAATGGRCCSSATTVLLVSHNMSAITSLADRCLWLDQGRIRELGDPARIVAEYLAGDAVSAQPGFADLSDPKLREGVPKQTGKEVLFDWVRLVDDEGKPSDVFFEGDPLTIELGLESTIDSTRLEALCFVRSLEGVLVFTLTSGSPRRRPAARLRRALGHDPTQPATERPVHARPLSAHRATAGLSAERQDVRGRGLARARR